MSNNFVLTTIYCGKTAATGLLTSPAVFEKTYMYNNSKMLKVVFLFFWNTYKTYCSLETTQSSAFKFFVHHQFITAVTVGITPAVPTHQL